MEFRILSAKNGGDRSPADAGDAEEGKISSPIGAQVLSSMDGNMLSKSGSESESPKRELRNGYRLEERARKTCPATKTGIALEEIDPFYKEGTFVVIGPRTHVINRFSSDAACMDATSPIRRWAIAITTHWLFTTILIKLILSNCVTSIFTVQGSKILEIISLVIFAVEMVLKLIARGLFTGRFSYLKIPWNWLDIAIVSLGILALTIERSSFHWLTILRTFKLIPLIPGMLSAYDLLSQSAKRMLDFIIVAIFSIFGFSIVGVQLYMGRLTSKCVRDLSQYEREDLAAEMETFHTAFEEFARNSSNWLTENQAGDFVLCGMREPWTLCPENYTCVQGNGPNPDFGYTSFDSFWWAVLSTIRLMMQEYFQLLYQQMLKTTWTGRTHILFFFSIFAFGTFTLGSFAYALIGKQFVDIFEKSKSSTQVENDADAEEENGAPSVRPKAAEGERGARLRGRVTVLKKNIVAILAHPLYKFTLTKVILLDVGFLFAQHYGAPPWFYQTSLAVSGVAAIIYAIEFVLKLIAESPTKYFLKFWNCFDALIVILAVVHFSALVSWESMSQSDSIYAIRAFKLAPLWPSFGFILKIIGETVWTFYGTIGVLGVHLFNFSLLGFILFSSIAGIHARMDFSVFWRSLGANFRILLGEWIELLWDLLREDGRWVVIIAYIAGAILFGNLLVMTLAVATISTTRRALEKSETETDADDTTCKTSIPKTLFYPIVWLCTKLCGYCKLRSAEKIHSVPEETQGNPAENAAAAAATVPASAEAKQKTKQVPGENMAESRRNILAFTQKMPVQLLSIVVVIVTSIVLPLPAVKGIYFFDILFTVYFMVEVVLKIVGLGFRAGIKNAGLILDTVLVIEMIVNFSVYRNLFNRTLTCTTGACGYFYLRNFRPLMIISRIERLKVIAKGIWAEVKTLGNYVLAAAVLWLIFANIGVLSFGGWFYSCSDYDLNPPEGIHTKRECQQANFNWVKSDDDFNDIYAGARALAHVASMDNWIPIIYAAMDATGVNMQPEYERDPPTLLYFGAFYIICVYFVFNIFFGIMLHKILAKSSKGIFRTETQLDTYEQKVDTGKSPPNQVPPPENKVLLEIYTFVTNPTFEIGILIFILLDCLAFASDVYQQSQGAEDILVLSHGVILFIYTIEISLKLLAWRHHYFKSWLNILDLVMIVTALVGLAMTDLVAVYFISPALLRCFRLVRFLQIYRARKFLTSATRRTSILNFLDAFALVSPVLINLLLFYLIFFYTYTVFGSQLFDYNLQSSFSKLFEFATFSGWAYFLFRLESGDDGIGESESQEPRPRAAYTTGVGFVTSFLVITFLVVANAYLVFILEIINQIKSSEKNREEPGIELPEVESKSRNQSGKNQSVEISKNVEEPDDQVEVILEES